jgi:hypothetical protein
MPLADQVWRSASAPRTAGSDSGAIGGAAAGGSSDAA